MWALIEAADCESVLGSGFVGMDLLCMRSDKQEKQIERLERTKISKQAMIDWTKLKSQALKRSIRNFERKLQNCQASSRKRAKNIDSNEITPKKRKANNQSVVTPSPPKPLRTASLEKFYQ